MVLVLEDEVEVVEMLEVVTTVLVLMTDVVVVSSISIGHAPPVQHPQVPSSWQQP